jgi:putative transposase
MRKSRFTEEQIIAILAEQERGVPTAEVCRKHGVSTATFYKWKAKLGGLDVSDARRLKTLETENARLKKLLADTMLDNAALKELLGNPSDAAGTAGGGAEGDGGAKSPSAERAAWSASIRRPSDASTRRIILRSAPACARSRPRRRRFGYRQPWKLGLPASRVFRSISTIGREHFRPVCRINSLARS